jgi:proteasome lid subunit RPN8/RPN11
VYDLLTPNKEGRRMTTMVEKKFVVEIVYNGVTKSLQVQPEEHVTALLHKAIAAFGITQNAHLLSLYRQDGTLVPENESVERAGLTPDEVLLLRPNAVKGGGAVLRLAGGIVRATFDALRECGRGEYECAVYWTGPASEDFVDGLEHPVHRRSAFGYEIDDHWLTEFWKRLASSRRSVKVQVHTHPGEAFHSSTDDRWPIVSQVGFLSIVIPNFAAGEPSLDKAWVGRLLPNGTWRHVGSAAEAMVLA